MALRAVQVSTQGGCFGMDHFLECSKSPFEELNIVVNAYALNAFQQDILAHEGRLGKRCFDRSFVIISHNGALYQIVIDELVEALGLPKESKQTLLTKEGEALTYREFHALRMIPMIDFASRLLGGRSPHFVKEFIAKMTRERETIPSAYTSLLHLRSSALNHLISDDDYHTLRLEIDFLGRTRLTRDFSTKVIHSLAPLEFSDEDRRDVCRVLCSEYLVQPPLKASSAYLLCYADGPLHSCYRVILSGVTSGREIASAYSFQFKNGKMSFFVCRSPISDQLFSIKTGVQYSKEGVLVGTEPQIRRMQFFDDPDLPGRIAEMKEEKKHWEATSAGKEFAARVVTPSIFVQGDNLATEVVGGRALRRRAKGIVQIEGSFDSLAEMRAAILAQPDKYWAVDYQGELMRKLAHVFALASRAGMQIGSINPGNILFNKSFGECLLMQTPSITPRNDRVAIDPNDKTISPEIAADYEAMASSTEGNIYLKRMKADDIWAMGIFLHLILTNGHEPPFISSIREGDGHRRFSEGIEQFYQNPLRYKQTIQTGHLSDNEVDNEYKQKVLIIATLMCFQPPGMRPSASQLHYFLSKACAIIDNPPETLRDDDAERCAYDNLERSLERFNIALGAEDIHGLFAELMQSLGYPEGRLFPDVPADERDCFLQIGKSADEDLEAIRDGYSSSDERSENPSRLAAREEKASSASDDDDEVLIARVERTGSDLEKAEDMLPGFVQRETT